MQITLQRDSEQQLSAESLWILIMYLLSYLAQISAKVYLWTMACNESDYLANYIMLNVAEYSPT